MSSHPRLHLVAALVVAALWPARARADSFINFESGPVRPLALSPDGRRLFAVNTPDDRLAIFDVTPAGLTLAAEVQVGLEPVAIAARTDSSGRTQVWVVNHLSDSVSIVLVDPVDVRRSRVVGTLLVGDEPRDIVFGGHARSRAFVTTARRGQNLPASVPPLPNTPGVGRALVWAFDADAVPSVLEGEPLAVLELFGDSPRALATSPDGGLVYAAIFQSGNRTTSLPLGTVAQHGLLPPPPADSLYAPDRVPPTGLIVQFDPPSGGWLDEVDRDWSPWVRLALPDQDVFVIDADADPPSAVPGGTVSGVGTVLFNMAVRPDDGKLFVTNTEARNAVRFEPVLRGHFAENRITIVSGTSLQPVHLNPHVDYGVPTGPPSEGVESLAIPLDLVFSGDGKTLYVAGFGSAMVGVFDADDLERGVVTRELIPVGGGPCGLALDERGDRLYVLDRFEESVSIVTHLSDPTRRAETATASLRFDPSPVAVKRGRRFLYDAGLSGHGDAACATCHVFGDLDALAWDLGDPYGPLVPDPNPVIGPDPLPLFHPMKGPMTTQSLRGMAGQGPMHWRGDRTGGNDPGGDPLSEQQAFAKFNPAFVRLMGGARQLSTTEMQAFTDFALGIRYPPNPLRRLDDQPTLEEVNGARAFGAFDCPLCHNPKTLGHSISILGGEGFKLPHFRNLYAKIGMFGEPPAGFEEAGFGFPATPFLGDQIRGFGYFHDGSLASVFEVLSSSALSTAAVQDRLDAATFLLTTDTGLAPAVGQQVSSTPATVGDPATLARRDLLAARAVAGDCDLVVKTADGAGARGGVMTRDGLVVPDRALDAPTPLADVWSRGATAGSEQVFTCVPPGAGVRTGIDRDEDGFLDRDEIDAGTNPADPLDFPGGPHLVRIPITTLDLRDGGAGESTIGSHLRFTAASDAIVAPPAGAAGDPTHGGAMLRIYNGAGSGEQRTVVLPSEGWRALPSGGYGWKGSGPITHITVRRGRLVVSGTTAGFTLDEPQQRRIAIRLTLGTGDQWCAEASARAQGRPPSTASNDKPGRFRAQPRTPPPVECQAPPAG